MRRAFAQLVSLLHHHLTAPTPIPAHHHPPSSPFSSLSLSPPHPPPPSSASSSDLPPLWAIVGLGNPGRRFLHSRHNVGAALIAHLARAYDATLSSDPSLLALSALCTRTLPRLLTRAQRNSLSPPPPVLRRLLLATPTTFMNLSGSSLALILPLLSLHPPSSPPPSPHPSPTSSSPSLPLIVIYDDVDLPLGTVRLALTGAVGCAHNGVRDVVPHTGDRFLRIRVGVGSSTRPRPGNDLTTYVMGRFERGEEARLRSDVYPRVRALVEGICAGDLQQARSLYQGDAGGQDKRQQRGVSGGGGGEGGKGERRGGKRGRVTAQPPPVQA